MILDDYVNIEEKIYISIISGMIWIYYRTRGCYKLLPRESTPLSSKALVKTPILGSFF